MYKLRSSVLTLYEIKAVPNKKNKTTLMLKIKNRIASGQVRAEIEAINDANPAVLMNNNV